MSTKNVTYCDNCEKPKGPLNHWHTAIETPDSFTVAEFDKDAPGLVDLCGEECLIVRLQRWLSRPKARAAATTDASY